MPVPTPLPVAVPPRFVPGLPIGRGAFGSVWAARDEARGDDVAIKVIPLALVDARRLEREVRALSHLSVPGVVALRAWGTTEDAAWLVMDLARGAPFPGRPGPVPWAWLAPRARSLLERVAALHDSGVVHRDLKPANVLVDDDGAVTLLDLGLARGARAGASFTATGAIVGTPRYMAPEVARGRRGDAASDLFSVGVMLYEALAGVVPHDGDGVDAATMLFARARDPVPRLQVAGVPRALVVTVDALLAADPSSRPASARAALRLWDGVGPRVAELPYLGDLRPLDLAAAAVRAGTGASISGPPGSGRTRWLSEVASRVAASGWQVRDVPHGKRPFESLLGVFTDLVPSASLASDAAARLAGLVAERVALRVDGLVDVDAWSRRLLQDHAGRAPLLMSTDDGPPLLPLTAAEVAPLFAGPERFFHLVSDASSLVLERTGGLPGAVVRDLDAWVVRGLAAWVGGRLKVDRSDLERVAAVAPPTGHAPVPEALRGLHRWLALAGPDVDAATLARARGVALFEVELELAALEHIGRARRAGVGYVAVGRTDATGPPDLDEDVRIHAAIARALPEGTPERLAHLVAAGDVDNASREVVPAAAGLVAAGRPAAAVGLVEQVVELGGVVATWDLAATLGAMSWCDRSGGVPARVRAAAARADLDPTVSQLLDAADRGEAPAVASFGDDRLEALRRDLVVAAARGRGGAAWAAEVASAGAWAEASSSAEVRARGLGWRADLAYATGDHAVAAALAEEAARVTPLASDALVYLYRSAGVRLEDADVDGVRALGGELVARAAALRLPLHEARGALVLRILAERTGEARAVDEDLVDAASSLGSDVLAGHLWLVEARVAWRLGDEARGRELAERAAAALAREPAARAAWLCAKAVGRVCGATDDVSALLAVLDEIDRPDVDIEVIGLLAGCSLPPGPWEARVEAAAARLPGYRRSWPHGALSVEAALQRVRAAGVNQQSGGSDADRYTEDSTG
jgi:serine/threonine-protein kinase